MKLEIQPTQTVAGEIIVPGSKSHTIRAVAMATLADGISTLHYPLTSEDTRAALTAARALGAEVLECTEQCWRIRGNGGRFPSKIPPIDVANSGTTLRIFSALATLADTPVIFDGDASLRTRPMTPLLQSLTQLGVHVESTNGKAPLTLTGPLRGGDTTLEAVSSQFLTALLFAAPLADTDETRIHLSLLNEKPYIQITLDWLNRLNIKYEMSDDMMMFRIPGHQRYTSFERTIPADFSTATFPLVTAMIMHAPLTIRNLDFTDSQGDKAVFKIATQMGATIIHEGDTTTVLPPKGPIRALPALDLNDTPDALPALAVLASFAEGTTRIVNTPQARLKETDRIACMTAELRKMGIEIEETPDGMIITPGKSPLKATRLCGYADHRIVMALSIAALRADGVSEVDTAEAAMVTYPDFVKDMQKLGAKFKLFQD